MTTFVKDKLVAFLISNYSQLTRRLASKLGSVDRAQEALHDTYVRLNRETGNLSEPDHPQSYLVRMAINVAHNRRRSEGRILSALDVDMLIEIPDESPDPYQVTEGRSDLEAVMRAIDALPPRRAAIFRRAWMDNAAIAVIATEFGIAERTVRHEVMLAVRALHEATKDKSVMELQKRLAKVSFE